MLICAVVRAQGRAHPAAQAGRPVLGRASRYGTPRPVETSGLQDFSQQPTTCTKPRAASCPIARFVHPPPANTQPFRGRQSDDPGSTQSLQRGSRSCGAGSQSILTSSMYYFMFMARPSQPILKPHCSLPNPGWGRPPTHHRHRMHRIWNLGTDQRSHPGQSPIRRYHHYGLVTDLTSK
jgi:hypothetical protein